MTNDEPPEVERGGGGGLSAECRRWSPSTFMVRHSSFGFCVRMHLGLFDYHLPPHLIAQEPCAERDRSRLLVVGRSDQSLRHHIFSDLPDLLSPGDLLVLNDTRVLPARLLGRRAGTGGQWQGLFLGQLPDG